jgi:hypothetical protein
MVKLLKEKSSPEILSAKKQKKKAKIGESPSPKKLKSKLALLTEDFDQSMEPKDIESPEDHDDEIEEASPIKRKKLGKKKMTKVDGVDRPKKKSKRNDDDEADADDLPPKKKSKKHLKPEDEISKLKEEIESLKTAVEEGGMKKPKNDAQAKWEQRQNEWYITPMDEEVLEEQKRRQHERDGRSLHFKFPSKNIKDEELQALSTDILSINRMQLFFEAAGWMYFANEKICKINLEKLDGMKIGEGELKVSHCIGYEGKRVPKIPDEEKKINALKLDISCLVSSTTEADLEAAFPTAKGFYRHPTKMPTYAFAFFETTEIAREAFMKAKDKEINGVKVTVLFARPSKNERGKVGYMLGSQMQTSFPSKKPWQKKNMKREVKPETE